MDKQDIYDLYLKTHNQMIEQNGFTEKSLWGSTASQQLRFKVLSTLFNSKKDFSVLDVGCGLCDFYSYLKDNGFENISYTGLEINPAFVTEVQNRNPNIEVIQGSVNELPADRKWDYVIASGIYNLGVSPEETEAFFVEQFKALFPQINIGFGVNFLSFFSNNKDTVSMYHQPSILIDLCICHFSKHIRFFHDYLPHDFSILVYKEQQVY